MGLVSESRGSLTTDFRGQLGSRASSHGPRYNRHLGTSPTMPAREVERHEHQMCIKDELDDELKDAIRTHDRNRSDVVRQIRTEVARAVTAPGFEGEAYGNEYRVARGVPSVSADRFGTLAVQVQPGDAVVRVDGEVWTGFEGLDRVVVELGEGIHTVEVRRDGYRTYQTNVEIVEGDTTLLNVSLPAAEDVR